LDELKRQAEREDGQLLILTSEEAAAGLSTLPSDFVSKDSNSSSNFHANGEDNSSADAKNNKQSSLL
jgi:hypothetical protein